MESTKSGKVIEIDEPNLNADTTKPKRARIMGGSKSGVIFVPPADTTKKKLKFKIMPGSKSGEIFTPEPIDTTHKKKKIKPKK